MDKVIIERERRGSSRENYRKGMKGYNRKLQREGLDCLQKESMSRHRLFGWDSKDSTDNLNPLIRYLVKQVGRKWDDVYSEICTNFSHKSVVQSHLRDHVNDIVSMDIIMIDGHPYYRSYNRPIKLESWRYDGLYVDPTDGILKKVKPQQRRKYKHKPFGVKINNKLYVRVNNVWYEFLLGPRKTRIYLPDSPFDYTELSIWGNSVVVGKKQLNKKEIKELNLNSHNYDKNVNITIIKEGHRVIKVSTS